MQHLSILFCKCQYCRFFLIGTPTFSSILSVLFIHQLHFTYCFHHSSYSCFYSVTSFSLKHQVSLSFIIADLSQLWYSLFFKKKLPLYFSRFLEVNLSHSCLYYCFTTNTDIKWIFKITKSFYCFWIIIPFSSYKYSISLLFVMKSFPVNYVFRLLIFKPFLFSVFFQ